MKIWCLFSIDNAYDQPENNLFAWWEHKPSLMEIGNAIGIQINWKKGDATLGRIFKGEEVRFDGRDFRLSEMGEGKLPTIY